MYITKKISQYYFNWIKLEHYNKVEALLEQQNCDATRVKCKFSISAESNIQRHHHYEAEDCSPTARLPVSRRLAFWHDVVNHDVDHGARSKGQGVGEDGDYETD